MKTLALLLVLLLCACASQPGATLPLTQAAPLELNGQTRTGVTIQSPYVLKLPHGFGYQTALGNPGGNPVTVQADGPAEFTQIKLDAGAWKPLDLAGPKNGSITLTWKGPPLYLSQVYRNPKGASQPPSILLVSVDTLRADHFSPQHMPQTYALFKEHGLITTTMKTTAPWTLPAHASLLTARYPAAHGVRRPDQKLPEQAVTLAEVLRDAGYYAYSINEGNYVSATFGLAQGFHDYLTNAPDMMAAQASKLEANLETLATRLNQHTDHPVFAFFHTYEVHCPYVPRGGLTDEAGYGRTAWLLNHEFKIEDPAVYDQLKALYAAEVAYTDAALAPMLKRLLAQGWLVALVSDHGEEFGEHGGLLHADTLYDEVTRIPFALAGPGVDPAHKLREGASIIDVAPTLIQRVGVPIDPSWQGRDLLDPSVDAAPVFAETYFLGPAVPAQDPRLLAVWMGVDKLIQTQNFNQTRAELYHLDQDPLEAQNQALTDVQKRDLLFLIMERYLKHAGDAAGKIDGLTPEQLETMRALGYIK